MGVLYVARREGRAGYARPVAIKVIHDHLAQNKRFCRMFIAEAKLSARIDDAHVVRVEEFGEADGRYYLVMELVHGVSLAQALGVLKNKGGLPLDIAVAIGMDIASGLHAAHEATDEQGVPLGIVHRDVSPHNVLVSYKGYVKVIDFGVAKARETAGQTLTGALRGKLAYMPPEQARSAKHVDRRADVYALGLVVWEMLVGRRVFDGKSDLELLNQIRSPQIVPPSTVNPRVPEALDEVVLRLLAEAPDDRPATAAQAARMLGDAWPTATKVLATDVAAVMNEVRVAATSNEKAKAVEGEPDPSVIYLSEIEEHLQSVASVEGDLEPDLETDSSGGTLVTGPVIPAALLAQTGAGHGTEVMSRPPVSLGHLKDTVPPPGPSAPPTGAAVIPPEEPTRKFGALKRPQPHASIGAGIPGSTPSSPDLLFVPPPQPEAPAAPKPAFPTAVAAPVIGLGVLGVVALVLLVVHCAASSEKDARRVPTEAELRYEQARQASVEGNFPAVRELLEARVRAGEGTPKEAALVHGACINMGDRACADDVRARFPDAGPPKAAAKGM